MNRNLSITQNGLYFIAIANLDSEIVQTVLKQSWHCCIDENAPGSQKREHAFNLLSPFSCLVFSHSFILSPESGEKINRGHLRLNSRNSIGFRDILWYPIRSNCKVDCLDFVAVTCPFEFLFCFLPSLHYFLETGTWCCYLI